MPRRLLPALLLLGACQQAPMQYIPQADRTLLQAQARLGEGGTAAATPQQRTSVGEMLSRARGAGEAAPARLVLRFEGDAVQLDPRQRQALEGFAAANRGAPNAVVISRPSGRDGLLVNQRRALAVARLLEADFRNVQLRFEREAPAGQVLVLREAGTGLAVGGATQGQRPPQ